MRELFYRNGVVHKIVDSVKYQEKPEGKLYKFFYKTTDDSELKKEARVDYASIEYTIINPINYDDWNRNIVPLALAYQTLGYDMNKLTEEEKSDLELMKKAQKRSKWFIPITEEEYNVNN